jgi:hypothetical protein
LPSAFVSYAHADQEFVLELVDHLRAQGLVISYDQVVLYVGDSLIERISQAISDGDFLIAIVSPDSVESSWCQRELNQATTEAIDEKRVKVLPVRFRGVDIPPKLKDTYYVDADQDDPETVARRLAAAMQTHLEGRSDAEAARAAEQTQAAEGTPAHEEAADDVDVARIDDVADQAADVITAVEGVWTHDGNVYDLSAPQRRLRLRLDRLPERLRVALPLVQQLATADPRADWDTLFGGPNQLAALDQDIRDELLSARTQVAQGLPVTRRWVIDSYLGTAPVRRDAICHQWRIARGDEARLVEVYISRSAIASDNEHLPREVAEAKASNGRSVVVTFLGRDHPPEEITVTSVGISDKLPP